ncbi:MAG: proton-conducting transporter membrane subunit [Gemmatimonadaceae bacterium]
MGCSPRVGSDESDQHDLFCCSWGRARDAVVGFRTRRPATQRIGIASIGIAVLAMVAVIMASMNDLSASPGIVAVDGFRWAADMVFLLGAIITIAVSLDYGDREGIVAGGTHVLVLFAVGGMMPVAASRDLMLLFLGIETMSVAVYVLAGLNRRNVRSAEGALKYFLLGAFSTAFLLYGIALIYGSTRSTNFEVVGERIVALQLQDSAMLWWPRQLCAIGFAFRWQPPRSTCGRLTSTRERPRRSRASWPRR